jgi:hypothetical protein
MPKPGQADGKSEAPRSPASRRPPTVSGKTRLIVSKERSGVEADPKSRADRRPSELPTIPPPPPPPAVPPVEPAGEGKSGEIARKRPRGIAVDEVTANLSLDPRREK